MQGNKEYIQELEITINALKNENAFFRNENKEQKERIIFLESGNNKLMETIGSICVGQVDWFINFLEYFFDANFLVRIIEQDSGTTDNKIRIGMNEKRKYFVQLLVNVLNELKKYKEVA